MGKQSKSVLRVSTHCHVFPTCSQDIVSQPYYEYGTLNRGIIRRAFRTSNNTLFRNMWRYMQAHEDELLTDTNEEGQYSRSTHTVHSLSTHTVLT